MKRRTAFYLFAGLLLLGLVYLVSDYGIGLSGSLRPIEAGAAFKLDYGIPAVVHQTWKASISPPSELVRWRDGCTRLNKGFSFQMYSDEDLYAFTKKHYQRYLGMFEALHGVYMADMARVLLAYHFGGIYMDLDFYCHRPFRCLLSHVKEHLYTLEEKALINGGHSYQPPRHILVVATEPLAHAVIFRNKTRVVIQDFYMATPRHPFFLWLLEDRLAIFQSSAKKNTMNNATPAPPDASISASAHIDTQRDQGGTSSEMSDGKSTSGGGATAAPAAVGAFPKGPFSYSIEKDIDRYHQQQQKQSRQNINNDLNSGSTTDELNDVIVELPEAILHPLVDSTNSRLQTQCSKPWQFEINMKSSLLTFGMHKQSGFTAGENVTLEDIMRSTRDKHLLETPTTVTDQLRDRVCSDVLRGIFFKPHANTVMVHMWTHVYLGWSFVRGLYNAWTYYTVEHALPPTQQCQGE